MEATEIAQLVAAAVGLMSAVATATPNTSTSKVLTKVLQVINIFGMNFGKARNAE